jgi:uncharacterized damage-inducible protein DinB
MPIVDSFLQELEQEAATTRRVLERVPTDKLDWQPHPKSMSLGQLATHIAKTPGAIAALATGDSWDVAGESGQGSLASTAEILAAFEADIALAKTTLGKWDDATATANWSVTNEGKTLMTLPRIGAIRMIALNHWYHHRGQLSVYLRLLDVPLPSIYGPSADENPFA